MALSIVREVNRSLGYSLAAGVTILAGQPLMLASATSVQPFNNAVTNSKPMGLALEDTLIDPLQGANGLTAGQGYDYTNFARGGLYSYLCDGGEVLLFNDGRGNPFNPGDTYTLNAPVYANSSGFITSTMGSNPLIGYVTNVIGSPVTQLQIKIVI